MNNYFQGKAKQKHFWLTRIIYVLNNISIDFLLTLIDLKKIFLLELSVFDLSLFISRNKIHQVLTLIYCCLQNLYSDQF